MKNLYSKNPDIASLTKDYADKHGGFKATEAHMSKYAAPKRVEVKSQIRQILYTSKKAFEGKDMVLFYHDFEGNKPFYATDGHSHHVLGGAYTVTNHGIEDDSGDDRTIPSGTFSADLRPPAKCVGMGKMHGLILTDGTEIDLSKKSLILAYAKVKGRQTLFILPECPTTHCRWGISEHQPTRASSRRNK